MRQRKLLGCALTASLLLGAVGCSSGSSTKAAAATTVPLGFIGELTGTLGSFGVPFANGARLAVDQINAAGGFKVNGRQYKFSINVVDDQSSSTQAAANAQGFVRDDRIQFVFGGLADIAPVVLHVTSAAKAMYFTGSSLVSAYMGTPEGQYLFSTVPSATQRYRQAADGIKTFLPTAKTAVMIGYNDQVDTAGFFTDMTQLLKAQGISIVGQQAYAKTITDFSGVLSYVKNLHPDILIIGSSSVPQDVTILKQNAQFNAAPAAFVYGEACNDATAAGISGTLVGDPLVGTYLTPPATPQAKAFVNAYSANFGIPYDTAIKSPLYATSWSYDFVGMLAKAMEAAKTTTDVNKITAALRSLTYQGLVGTVSFNSQGQSNYPSAMCLYQDNQLTVKSFK